MSQIEAIPGDLASRRTPSGLEVSGLEFDLNPQEVSDLIENAPAIAASHFALERVRTYANIIGEHGAQVSQKARHAIGVLVIPTLAFVAACGSHAETATRAVPVSTPVVSNPVATGETIVATPTPVLTSLPKETPIPVEVKKIDPENVLNNLESLVEVVPDQNREDFRKAFEQDLIKAKDVTGKSPTAQFKQSEPYRNLYSKLKGFYMTVRLDPAKEKAVRSDLQEIETAIKTAWPELYASLASGDTFILPETS